MSKFELNNTVDKDKVFLTQFFDIEGRLDAFYYKREFIELLSAIKKHPKLCSKSKN